MMYGVRRLGIVLPIAGLVLGLTVVFPTSAVGNEVVKWNETMLKAIVANGQSNAGIHFRSACEDGLALARSVSGWRNSTSNLSGSERSAVPCRRRVTES